MKKHVKIRIFGKVQGVWFRQSAKEQADLLGVFGFVTNMPDGSMCIEAEGEEGDLQKMIAWCQRGSEGSRVESVEKNFSDELENYEGFDIRK